jgi:hypothetical protein
VKDHKEKAAKSQGQAHVPVQQKAAVQKAPAVQKPRIQSARKQ